jgi:hypothetical protein
MARALQLTHAMRFALLLVLALPAVASAQPSAQPGDKPLAQAASEETVAVAIAVNPPFRWKDGDGVAASGYIGFRKHHVIRLNVASFANHGNIAGNLIALGLGQDGDEGFHSGRTTDVGIGWQYFRDDLFDGFSIEVGAFRRAIDIRAEDEFDSPEVRATKATGYAVRALFGWSWLFSKRAFIATALGLSAGHYKGTNTTADHVYEPQYMNEDFETDELGAELYLRFGVAFGL